MSEQLKVRFGTARQISSTGMHEEDYCVLDNIILYKSILAHIDTPGLG